MPTMTILQTAQYWHEKFNHFAGDLYPGRYTENFCYELACQAEEIRRVGYSLNSVRLAHYYTYPEVQEVAHFVGDSLALSLKARELQAPRVDFQGVFFMGTTAKILSPNSSVFMPGGPETLGCSLVFGTDIEWVKNWKQENPFGIIVTYVNSDVRVKALSDWICTSRNAGRITAEAVRQNPGKKILLLPDKFLGDVMKGEALEILQSEKIQTNPDLIEVYDRSFNGFNACCYVHEQLGNDALEVAQLENPDAILMVHPECGCSSHCRVMLSKGEIPREKAIIRSTKGMIDFARKSPARKFLVATEAGHLYALRKELPEKEFIPISTDAKCKYMKSNTLQGMISSLRNDAVEIVLCRCNDCLKDQVHHDHKLGMVYISQFVADQALVPIERGLTIQ